MLQKLVSVLMAYALAGVELLTDAYDTLKAKVSKVAHGERAFVTNGYYGMYTPKLPRFMQANRGQLGFSTVIAAAVVVVAVFVVIIVVDNLDQSLGDPQSSELNNSSNDVLAGFSDMTSLIGPMLIVAIAVVIISLVRRTQEA